MDKEEYKALINKLPKDPSKGGFLEKLSKAQFELTPAEELFFEELNIMEEESLNGDYKF